MICGVTSKELQGAKRLTDAYTKCIQLSFPCFSYLNVCIMVIIAFVYLGDNCICFVVT